MRNLLKCHLLRDAPSRSELVPTKTHFILLKTLVYESHIFRYIFKCRKCEQLYFFEFYEEIDWEDGEDPQYTTYIPIKSVEEGVEINKKNQIELLSITPRLQVDWPKGEKKTVRWVR